jgi:hypothetical protein
VRIISWNIGCRAAAWDALASDPSVDIALLQEAVAPKADIGFAVTPSRDEPWKTSGSERSYATAVAWRPERIAGIPIKTACLGDPDRNALCVSRQGTLAALEVPVSDGTVTLVSAYAMWERHAGAEHDSWIYADASACAFHVS